MKARPLPLLLAAASLAGCAQTNPPLMFGDVTSFGLRLGNDTASAGASVSLGYKDVSLAMVPVTALQGDGKVYRLEGRDVVNGKVSSRSDAMSVFASFGSSSSKSTGTGQDSQVRLGELFSTGLASQVLTRDLCIRVNSSSACTVKAGEEPPPADRSANAATAATAASDASKGHDSPYQWPLLFMRTDVLGIDIGGSQAQQGMQFVLGYGVKNLAIIPVVARDGLGNSRPIASFDDGTNESARDTLSVLGQFEASTSTTTPTFKLDRYFATGIAARNLGAAAYALAGAEPASGAASATTASVPTQSPAVRELASR